MEINWFQIKDYKEQLQEMGKAHYEEISYSKEDPNLNLDMLQQLQDQNLVLALGLIHEGNLLAYYINIMSPSLFGNYVESRDIGIYTRPEFRGQGVSKQLQEIMDEELKACGVKLSLAAYPFEIQNPNYTLKEFVYERKL